MFQSHTRTAIPMSPAAFLLRLLLCIGLILNGSAYAAQSVAMPAVTNVHSGLDAAASPCHSQPIALATQALSVHADQDLMQLTGTMPDHGNGDCCQSSDCVQSCHSQAPLALHHFAACVPSAVASTVPVMRATRHAATFPAPLIRPPIV